MALWGCSQTTGGMQARTSASWTLVRPPGPARLACVTATKDPQGIHEGHLYKKNQPSSIPVKDLAPGAAILVRYNFSGHNLLDSANNGWFAQLPQSRQLAQLEVLLLDWCFCLDSLQASLMCCPPVLAETGGLFGLNMPLWLELSALIGFNVLGASIFLNIIKDMQDSSEPLTVAKVQVRLTCRATASGFHCCVRIVGHVDMSGHWRKLLLHDDMIQSQHVCCPRALTRIAFNHQASAAWRSITLKADSTRQSWKSEPRLLQEYAATDAAYFVPADRAVGVPPKAAKQACTAQWHDAGECWIRSKHVLSYDLCRNSQIWAIMLSQA